MSVMGGTLVTDSCVLVGSNFSLYIKDPLNHYTECSGFSSNYWYFTLLSSTVCVKSKLILNKSSDKKTLCVMCLRAAGFMCFVTQK